MMMKMTHHLVHNSLLLTMRRVQQVSIGTVHLESLDSAQLRAEQLEKISGKVTSWSQQSAIIIIYTTW
jgi:hypothetical protein